MHSQRQLVKLLLTSPLGNQQIAKITHASKTTVKRYRDLIQSKGLTWAELQGLSDDALDASFNKVSRRQVKKRMPDFAYIHQELGRPCVTLLLVWEEYRTANPEDAMCYSQFTEHYRRYVRKLKPFMRQPLSFTKENETAPKTMRLSLGLVEPLFSQKTNPYRKRRLPKRPWSQRVWVFPQDANNCLATSP